MSGTVVGTGDSTVNKAEFLTIQFCLELKYEWVVIIVMIVILRPLNKVNSP